MKALQNIKRIYFIGIGGIGMSAIARYFNEKATVVSGYDKTRTALCEVLEQEGMMIHYTDDIALLDKDADLVVYTPAIPKDHTELNWYRDNGYEVVKRSDVLQIISEGTFNICIAGTHGKTTTTGMVGHLLKATGYGCNAFIGGIAVNYNSNFWSSEKNVAVIEADEFDRSFLKLSPDIAIITAMDPDHLDIYGDTSTFQEAFKLFAGRVKPSGILIRHQKLKQLNEIEIKRQLTYELENEEAICYNNSCGHDHDDHDAPDVYAENIRFEHGAYIFDATISHVTYENLELNIGGLHNIENMLSAITVATMLGIDKEKISEAVAGFRGIKRRFEYIFKKVEDETLKQIYIDDYAHHPEELRALLKSAKHLFPGMKCKIIFQPHLFTRTRDFAPGFAEVLNMADEVVLLPIYPARELPIEGVNSEMLLKGIGDKAKVLTKEEALKDIKATDKLIITAGAGDIDTLVGKIKEILSKG
ncbi:UDP-N-acetylmuramate--L-alanine ligase [Polluticaenibacter yanchengensis]|uniref:UDP-N-acetylmuramate--L-alanine ligase n=1 Tax=Polluticaenibacter yanchengensis TaxID=3014562 RepID=A0ABT4UH47_9BACT|nr:UDP-N-acetylmuramate--L-alanine ligase [Chitinophagaceae bacterium LY-5]